MISAFEARWGETPQVFRASGRVNLIGEFTDYNDGFVMPSALAFGTSASAAVRLDRWVEVYSEGLAELSRFSLDDPNTTPRSHWSDYVRGAAIMLERAGHRLRGANLLIHSDVPMGAGLSSSAALEVAVAKALLSLADVSITPTELAQLCQRAENEFVGVQCGIMDQFSACHGEAGKVLLLDCRSLDYRLVPIPEGASVVICNTMVKHELARSEYNLRRAECSEGVAYLQHSLPSIITLRDVTLTDLERHADKMPEVLYWRCRHVISESHRVEQAAAALAASDLEQAGRLMRASHRSLRDDFQVSCKELNYMVEIALRVPGVYGARMTGGGFGGCTVNLIRTDAVDEFKQTVTREYRKATGKETAIYV